MHCLLLMMQNHGKTRKHTLAPYSSLAPYSFPVPSEKTLRDGDLTLVFYGIMEGTQNWKVHAGRKELRIRFFGWFLEHKRVHVFTCKLLFHDCYLSSIEMYQKYMLVIVVGVVFFTVLVIIMLGLL